MPTLPMRRVRTVVTGVAGSPYYLTCYYDAAVGTATQCIANWHDFVTNGGNASSFRAGATFTTEAETQIVDPVTGDVTGTEIGTGLSLAAGGSVPFLPFANQYLVRWKTGLFIGGRRLAGHTNLPFIAASDANGDGTPTTGTLTAKNARAATHIAGTTVIPVVYSRTKGQWAPKTSGSAAPFFSILRSRRD